MISSSVLVIYNHPISKNAPTIMEHVGSFGLYSKFKVWPLNVAYGFPKGLRGLEFSTVVLHYSLFGSYPFAIPEKFLKYIEGLRKSLKVVFFQDEMQHVQERFKILNDLGVDAIFTLLTERNFNHYLQNTPTKILVHTLTGYVSDDLIVKSSKYHVPFADRTINVGYRARKLCYHFGRGAREKSEIAERFLEEVQTSNLKLDISIREEDRIYGDDWYRFVANCKFMLGVMAGTSIFDFTGEVKRKTDEYLSQYPDASFAQVQEAVLLPYEDNLNYRTISPRLFECAALRVCMILYRDDYQGILRAGVHYISLEKDFSNIDVVLRLMQDRSLVDRIIENAYLDLIASGKWHYRGFMQQFDDVLESLGCSPSASLKDRKAVELLINKDARLRYFICWLKSLRSRSFPGRRQVKHMAYFLGFKRARR